MKNIKMKNIVIAILIMTVLMVCLGMTRGDATTFSRSAVSGLIKIDDDIKGLSVGLWVPPPPHLLQTTEGIEREYGRIKDAGMNLVWGAHWWSFGDKLSDILDICAHVGIDYIIPLPVDRYGRGELNVEVNNCLSIAETYMNHPAVSGFYMVDEPSAIIFDRLMEVRKCVDAVLPEGMYTIANLYPDGGPKGYLGIETYKEYVEQYMSQVQPKILSFDCYPLSLNPMGHNYELFIKNLLTIRENALKYNVPFWGFIQAIGFDGRREPTYNEIRWLNNMHILFGAKGYSYFLYSAVGPNGGGEHFTTSALSWDGNTTPLYDMIKSINTEFSAFDRTFIQFVQDGFILINVEHSVLRVFNENLLNARYGNLVSIKTDGVMLNGCFDLDGQKAVYLFNWNMNNPMTASLAFDGETIYELWGKDALEASGIGLYLEILLEAGESKFLVFGK